MFEAFYFYSMTAISIMLKSLCMPTILFYTRIFITTTLDFVVKIFKKTPARIRDAL